jgi:hypothetical protein
MSDFSPTKKAVTGACWHTISVFQQQSTQSHKQENTKIKYYMIRNFVMYKGHVILLG